VGGDVDDRQTSRRVSVVPVLVCGTAVVLLIAAAFITWPFGPSSEVNSHLDVLAAVVNAARPPSASSTGSFRNAECDSGVNEVGTTFRGSTVSDRSQYQRVLKRLGWRVAPGVQAGDTLDGDLATKKFDWGTAYFTVDNGLKSDEVDVSAGYNC
jgi:hypothetical protein